MIGLRYEVPGKKGKPLNGRRDRRRLSSVTSARVLVVSLVAGVAGGFVFALPPVPLPLESAPTTSTPGDALASPTVAGAFHVHTTRSDGAGSPVEVAAAAAAAGLDFVIFADHGDGTRPLAAPVYRSGVLCIDGVEISTEDGHYVAVGMRPPPYPLAGDAAGVVEDVARLGGFGVAAHPMSAKAELEWRAWDTAFDGLEWINADSEWRDEGFGARALVLFRYLFRPPQALAGLLDRPATTIDQWTRVGEGRPIVALAGADTHGRIAWGGGEPSRDVTVVELPRYEDAFRLFTTRVQLPAPLTGHAATDAASVLAAIRAGRVFTVIDALAPFGSFEFTAASGAARAAMGERLPLAGPIRLGARAQIPPAARMVLLRGSDVLHDAPGGTLSYAAPAKPGVYRIEIRIPSAPGAPPVPWLFSNPIYVGPPAAAAHTGDRPARDTRQLLASGRAWHVERDWSSTGQVALELAEGQWHLGFRYRLGDAVDAGQYAAAVLPIPGGLSGFDRVSFRGWADRPLRVSVQVRSGEGASAQRWKRSVYLDQDSRRLTIPFDELRPVEPGRSRHLDPGDITALLVVADRGHARSGAAGRITLADVAVERTR